MYFNYEIKTENGITFFDDKVKKQVANNERFAIYIYVPKETKPYFFPINYWKYVFGRDYDKFLRVDMISKVSTGLLTRSFPTSQSLFYEAPFFYILKTPFSTPSNYLTFKNFYSSNVTTTVLAMVEFSEEKENFTSIFNPEIILPNTYLFDNNILEIRLCDSLSQSIAVVDYSQLFIVLKIT